MEEAENLIRKELQIIKNEFKHFAKAKVQEQPKIEKLVPPKIDFGDEQKRINRFYEKEMIDMAVYFSDSLRILMEIKAIK